LICFLLYANIFTLGKYGFVTTLCSRLSFRPLIKDIRRLVPFSVEFSGVSKLFSLGGLHHAAARISGDKVYKHLKYEGGVHRVQRIPEVGLSSRMQRIHTGTMSVIVLPQPDEVTSLRGIETHSVGMGIMLRTLGSRTVCAAHGY
jgi:hypothetical protein